MAGRAVLKKYASNFGGSFAGEIIAQGYLYGNAATVTNKLLSVYGKDAKIAVDTALNKNGTQLDKVMKSIARLKDKSSPKATQLKADRDSLIKRVGFLSDVRKTWN